VGGKVVRTATGPNTRPGGSERLQQHAWDVRDLKGREAVIRIVDNRTGGWGHINVDHIVQSDTKPKVPVVGAFSRDFTINKKYLVIPIQNGANKCRLTLTVDGKDVRRYDTELATDADATDWYAYFTIESYKGQPATVSVSRAPKEGFDLIRQADEVPGEDTFYTEALRPQFHFSQKVGWNNDPNGMVYYDGEWHLFFQHNPVGWKWGNMTWGHAVSPDLVHWTQLPDAIHPDEHGTIFSGSAVADLRNTSGFQGDSPHAPLVCIFTYAGRFGTPPCPFTQGIAWSVDRGRTFTTYPKPVLGNQGPSNRDPKVIWHEPSGRWIMLLYLGRRTEFAFFGSKDLKAWTKLGDLHFPGGHECPEIFELPVDPASPKGSAAAGEGKAETRWVVYAGDAQYAIGRFDGKRFTPDHEGRHRVHWGAYYASQTFNNAPGGRRVQIGWGRITMKGMPFNQMMTFPCELTLRTTPDGLRMFAEPVKEIALLHKKRHALGRTVVKPDVPASVGVSGRLFDIRARFAVGDAKAFGLQVGGTKVTYDAAKATLEGMPLKPVDGKIHMQILVDRPSIEVFGNAGRAVQTRAFRSDGPIESIRAFAEGGPVTLLSLEVWELESAWK